MSGRDDSVAKKATADILAILEENKALREDIKFRDELISSAILSADKDKPHRCPSCWLIPQAAHDTGKAIVGVIYHCERCKTHWTINPFSMYEDEPGRCPRVDRCGRHNKHVGICHLDKK